MPVSPVVSQVPTKPYRVEIQTAASPQWRGAAVQVLVTVPPGADRRSDLSAYLGVHLDSAARAHGHGASQDDVRPTAAGAAPASEPPPDFHTLLEVQDLQPRAARYPLSAEMRAGLRLLLHSTEAKMTYTSHSTPRAGNSLVGTPTGVGMDFPSSPAPPLLSVDSDGEVDGERELSRRLEAARREEEEGPPTGETEDDLGEGPSLAFEGTRVPSHRQSHAAPAPETQRSSSNYLFGASTSQEPSRVARHHTLPHVAGTETGVYGAAEAPTTGSHADARHHSRTTHPHEASGTHTASHRDSGAGQDSNLLTAEALRAHAHHSGADLRIQRLSELLEVDLTALCIRTARPKVEREASTLSRRSNTSAHVAAHHAARHGIILSGPTTGSGSGSFSYSGGDGAGKKKKKKDGGGAKSNKKTFRHLLAKMGLAAEEKPPRRKEKPPAPAAKAASEGAESEAEEGGGEAHGPTGGARSGYPQRHGSAVRPRGGSGSNTSTPAASPVTAAELKYFPRTDLTAATPTEPAAAAAAVAPLAVRIRFACREDIYSFLHEVLRYQVIRGAAPPSASTAANAPANYYCAFQREVEAITPSHLTWEHYVRRRSDPRNRLPFARVPLYLWHSFLGFASNVSYSCERGFLVVESLQHNKQLLTPSTRREPGHAAATLKEELHGLYMVASARSAAHHYPQWDTVQLTISAPAPPRSRFGSSSTSGHGGGPQATSLPEGAYRAAAPAAPQAQAASYSSRPGGAAAPEEHTVTLDACGQLTQFRDIFLILSETHLVFANSFGEIRLHFAFEEIISITHSTHHPVPPGSGSGAASPTAAAGGAAADSHPYPFLRFAIKQGTDVEDEPPLLLTLTFLPIVPCVQRSDSMRLLSPAEMEDHAAQQYEEMVALIARQQQTLHVLTTLVTETTARRIVRVQLGNFMEHVQRLRDMLLLRRPADELFLIEMDERQLHQESLMLLQNINADDDDDLPLPREVSGLGASSGSMSSSVSATASSLPRTITSEQFNSGGGVTLEVNMGDEDDVDLRLRMVTHPLPYVGEKEDLFQSYYTEEPLNGYDDDAAAGPSEEERASSTDLVSAGAVPSSKGKRPLAAAAANRRNSQFEVVKPKKKRSMGRKFAK